MTATTIPAQSGLRDAPPGLVGPDGTLHDNPGLDLTVTGELCRPLYRDMVLARRLDEEAYHLQRQGELGLWLSCRGQEAAQVGSIRALRGSDHVFPSYRDHAAALCRGIGPDELLSQWRGAAHGSWDPATYRFHIYSLVLATQLLHATGQGGGTPRPGTPRRSRTGRGASGQTRYRRHCHLLRPNCPHGA